MIIEYIGHASYLVEISGFRLVIDPWLTERLDRFWTHWPMLEERAPPRVDAIFVSHHHFDHHHFPSLAKLSRDAEVVFPKSTPNPKFTGSGMGHQALQWTFSRLGFHRQTPLAPFQAVAVGPAKLMALPSLVAFPECTLLLEAEGQTVVFAGDTMLHPKTEELFAGPSRPRVDLAILPAHSTSPPGPLLRRVAPPDYQPFVDKSIATLDRYVDTIDARTTIPGAFGWKVEADPAEEDFGWVNRTLFPYTPVQAARHLRARDRAVVMLGPTDRLELAGGTIASARGPWVEDEARLAPFCETITLDPATPIPQFTARAPIGGRPAGDLQTSHRLVERLAGALVGTDYWYRALAERRRAALRIAGDADRTYVLELWKPAPASLATDTDGLPYTWLHEETLRQFLDAELLFTSAYGLWAGDDDLLSAALHHPRFYVQHLERCL